ncbi:energy-coupling factor transporter transmembrane component T family protein [Cohnella candidum]|uniref:Energy-coupling factor transporter transmembrane protein EcfT n=1 Tax=Cohnella candidum TaxID=2674991 RepID=A0A3G3K3W2_9BACL|nr:energy-coupling factor transporter transmembrane component T [Cohnella candidum]AYQ74449.1 energy-coupling factor transporter transmembrane protein EcfT [Cohnella candidum]
MSASDYLMYRDRGSWLETLDPRAKMTAALLLAASLLLSLHPAVKGAVVLLLACAWAVARLPWRMLAITLLSMSLLFASTMAYHLLLSSNGAMSGLTMCLQIAGLVLSLALLVRTTSPLALAEGMERILAPLARRRVPVHEAAMMFTIALQFIPILLREFEFIRKAQIARGGGFHRGGVGKRLGGVFPILMPMIVRSIVRAEELATAMISRCYDGGEGRTSLRVYRWARRDTGVTLAAVLLLAIAAVNRIFG